MVPSNADIVIKKRRISQWETSARTIRDVIRCPRALIIGDQNAASPVC